MMFKWRYQSATTSLFELSLAQEMNLVNLF